MNTVKLNIWDGTYQRAIDVDPDAVEGFVPGLRWDDDEYCTIEVRNGDELERIETFHTEADLVALGVLPRRAS